MASNGSATSNDRLANHSQGLVHSSFCLAKQWTDEEALSSVQYSLSAVVQSAKATNKESKHMMQRSHQEDTKCCVAALHGTSSERACPSSLRSSLASCYCNCLSFICISVDVLQHCLVSILSHLYVPCSHMKLRQSLTTDDVKTVN